MKAIQNQKFYLFTLLVVTTAILLLPDSAHATAASGTSWDTPLTNIRNAFTGPIAFTLSLLGILVAGGMLVFGGELNEFARRMIMLVLLVAVLIFANQFLGDLWGATGTMVNGVAGFAHLLITTI